MTTPAIAFDVAAWKTRYPEFVDVPDIFAQGCFDDAHLYCANSTTNPAYADGVLRNLLWMLTAHLVYMGAPAGTIAGGAAGSSSGIVGAIASASEGSVSVSANAGDVTAGGPSQAWYMQTKYGANYWYATSGYRTARYSPRQTRVPGTGWPLWRGMRR